MKFGDKTKENTPQKIGFFILPRFSLMAYACTSEPLRIANWLTNKPLYEWMILSENGKAVAASNQMDIQPHHAIDEIDFLPMTVTFASHTPEKAITEKGLGWLRRQARLGALLGAVDTGSYILAQAGLLNNHQATIHWAHIDTFPEHFPTVDVKRDLYVIDRQRFTATGGTAGTDIMLQLITMQHGRDLAIAVAEQISYNQMREGSDPQRMDTGHRLATGNRYVIQAVEQMETHIEDPLRTSDLAQMLGISLRELERSFQKALKTSPGAYYRRMRLERAKTLLQQTDHSILEIAISCGFTSSAHFSRCYKSHFGAPPSHHKGN